MTKASKKNTAKPKETIQFLGKTWENGRPTWYGGKRFRRGSGIVEISIVFPSGFDAEIVNGTRRLLTSHGRTESAALAKLETTVEFVRGLGK